MHQRLWLKRCFMTLICFALAIGLVNFKGKAAYAAVPSPWLQQDIGSVGFAGSGDYATGTFTIKGSGTDIAGTADQFHYVYQPLNGDGTIVARVVSIANTSAWAKAGVMIRESLATGSRHASTVIEYASSSGAQFVDRTATGGSTATVTQTGVVAPYWVKLQRAGNTFTSAISSNGTTWTTVGTATVSMATSVYIGLIATSQNNSALNTSVLDNVTVSTPPDTTAPTAPTGLTSPSKTSTTVNLSWTDATDNVGVTGYDIYRGGTTLVGSTSGATTYAVTGLTASTAYSFTVKAKDAAGNVSAASSALNVTTNAASGGGSFVKGINFNGGAVTIGGNAWLAESAAGLTLSSVNRTTTSLTPSPAVDTATSSMLNDAIWSSTNLSVDQSIANGSYQLYLWIMENYQSNFRSFNLNLEGVQAAASIGSLALGGWAKYGPYAVTVSDGALDLDLIKATNDVHLMGMEIYTAAGGTDTTAPTAPTGLTSPSKTSTTVSLSWTASTDNVGVTGYNVYRGGTTLVGSTTGATSVTVTDLTANTAYSFTVKAKDAAGNVSAASSPLSVTTNAATGNRSGLPWKSGVYKDSNNDEDVASIEQFENYRGRLVDVTTNFIYRDSWDVLTNNTIYIEGWEGAPFTPVYAIPFFPENIGATFSACAAGDYNSHWNTFGTKLAAHGQGTAILRLGWEFNGNWFAHSVTASNLNDWKSCFRQVVGAIKATAPNVKIDWNVNRGDGLKADGNLDPALAYPGDDVVDYIGIDDYDQWEPAVDEASWNNQMNSAYGTQHWIDFAAAHGKKVSFPEWGLYHGTDGHHGNDNPFYINKMWALFNGLGTNLAYEAYYDEVPLTGGALDFGNYNPNSAAAYAADW